MLLLKNEERLVSVSILVHTVTKINISCHLAFKGMCSMWNTTSSPPISACLTCWINSHLHAINTAQLLLLGAHGRILLHLGILLQGPMYSCRSKAETDSSSSQYIPAHPWGPGLFASFFRFPINAYWLNFLYSCLCHFLCYRHGYWGYSLYVFSCQIFHFSSVYHNALCILSPY